jgi:hypothetical protein
LTETIAMMSDTPLSDDDLDRLLAARDPIDPSVLRTEGVSGWLVQLHSRLLDSPPPTSVPWTGRLRSRARVARLRLTVAVVALGAVAAAVVGIEVLEQSSSLAGAPLSVTPAAAETLDGLARAAEAGGSTRPLGPHQYEYVKLISYQLGGVNAPGPLDIDFRYRSVVQEWVNRDGQHRTRSAYTGFACLRGYDCGIYRAHRSILRKDLLSGSQAPGDVVDTVYPRGDGPNGSIVNGHGLPTTAAALLKAFRREISKEVQSVPAHFRKTAAKAYTTPAAVSSFEFGAIDQILAGSLSASQRAAAYTDLKYVSGLRVVGVRHDALGREGIALEVKGSDGVAQMLVDTADGELLQDENWLTKPVFGQPTNVAIYRNVYLQRAVVSSMQSLPNGKRVPYTKATLGR